jgi:hypothetical protein
MKRRMARWLFRLAPTAYRRRYEDDFDVLIDDLARTGELHWHQCLNIALVGGSDRLRQLSTVRRAVLVGTTLLLAGTVVFFSVASVGSGHLPRRYSADGPVGTTFFSVEEPAFNVGTTSTCPSPVTLRNGSTQSVQSAQGAGAVSILLKKTTKVVSIGAGYNEQGTCYFKIELRGGLHPVLATASAPTLQPYAGDRP